MNKKLSKVSYEQVMHNLSTVSDGDDFKGNGAWHPYGDQGVAQALGRPRAGAADSGAGGGRGWINGRRRSGGRSSFHAPRPWGPWTSVTYQSGWGAGNIQTSTFFWNFANKWLSADGKSFTLVFTGVSNNDSWNTVRGSFTVAAADSTPPSAPTSLAATAASASRIDLSWTAASDPESGVSSYNIYRDGVKVGTATGTSYSDTGLSASTSYSYQVSAVNGAALEGGLSNTASATTLDPPSGGLISNTSPAGYVWDVLDVGKDVYVDRAFTYTTVPAAYVGLDYLQTANNDKASTGAAFVTFDVSQDVTVYVAHDDRITTKPAWLSAFVDTGDNLVTSDTTLSLYALDFAAGTVTLGGNEGGGNSMYTVVVEVLGSGGGGDTDPPVIGVTALVVEGQVSDPTVASVSVDSQTVFLIAGLFSSTVPLGATATSFDIIATDDAGKTAQRNLTVTP